MARPFKFTLKGQEPVIVFADNLSQVEKHAGSLATEGVTAEARHLLETEYKTVDLKAEDVTRVPGGKEDATVTPFALTFNGKTIYRLASSLSNAEKYLQNEVQKAVGFEVVALPDAEYATTDWSKVETLASAPASKTAESAKSAEDGDAKSQADIKDIPGME